MSANIIDGKEVARKLRDKISRSVEEINSEHNIVPGLAVVLVGNDPASEVYAVSYTHLTLPTIRLV